ncbi:MAG TPA: hypothetical protein VKO85_02715 [Wenzhouxiangellaceae bacterium]|nr:hypothetical protein [Wenzhouxiangellaceae bacterium]
MNRLENRFAAARATSACAALWSTALTVALTIVFTVASTVAPHALAQETADSGQHGNRHQSMQAREFSNLRQGRGMGMGRVAGVNGYPGPRHVLEHAEALELTEGQIERSGELMARVKTRAPELGNQIVDAEKRLEAMFAEGSINAAKMDSLLLEIAELRAHLRSLHLTAHLDQAAVLTEAQLEKFKTLQSAAETDGERRPMRRMREMKREGQSGG